MFNRVKGLIRSSQSPVIAKWRTYVCSDLGHDAPLTSGDSAALTSGESAAPSVTDLSVGPTAVSMTVSATAVAALLGRLALARFADQIDARVTTAAVLLIAAGSLGAMALFPYPSILVGASIVVGLTVGNVTTLSPIIVRREFGAQEFGTVFGIASCGIQLIAALGPSFYGLLYDVFGSYRPALMIAAVLDIAAAIIAIVGHRKLTCACRKSNPNILVVQPAQDRAAKNGPG